MPVTLRYTGRKTGAFLLEGELESGWFVDTRLGGEPRYYTVRPPDWDMRIPDNLINCVCYLCVKISGGEHRNKYLSFGTGFFVGVHYKPDDNFMYLVTARHVVDDALKYGYKEIYARVNKKGGSVEHVRVADADKWIKWTNSAIDLAMVSAPLPPEDFDYEALPLEVFATDQKIKNHSIGLGDDLIAVGLFTLRTGKQRNIPIVRSGIVSAMPTEHLTKDGKPYRGYLAEMRSIGGLSGSPVFVFLNKQRPYQTNIPNNADWMFLFLGVIRGHWNLKKELDDSDLPTEDRSLGQSAGEDLNTGIAVITPAEELYLLVTNEKLEAQRREALAQAHKKDEPVEDSSLEEQLREDGGENLTHDSFVEGFLKPVSSRVSEPESEKKQTSD